MIVNEARALRVTEIVRDYQSIQRRISQFQANPPQGEANEIGYSSLRQCHTEARALLAVPYPHEMLHPPSAPNEAEKRQLQRYAPAQPSLHSLSPTNSGMKRNPRRQRPAFPGPENLPAGCSRPEMGATAPIHPSRTQAAERQPAGPAPG